MQTLYIVIYHIMFLNSKLRWVFHNRKINEISHFSSTVFSIVYGVFLMCMQIIPVCM